MSCLQSQRANVLIHTGQQPWFVFDGLHSGSWKTGCSSHSCPTWIVSDEKNAQLKTDSHTHCLMTKEIILTLLLKSKNIFFLLILQVFAIVIITSVLCADVLPYYGVRIRPSLKVQWSLFLSKAKWDNKLGMYQ